VSDNYTPTEQRIVDLLSDGMPHKREELHACLSDDLASRTAVQMHVSNIRKRIRVRGEEIICEYYHRNLYYRHVRLLNSPYDGRA
jgi:DNA-binding CsgD family transcriptional regulator